MSTQWLTDQWDLLAKVLEIAAPWRIEKAGIDEDFASGEGQADALLRWDGRLDVYLVADGEQLPCGRCGVLGRRRDQREERWWTALPLGAYEVVLHARVPRVTCQEHGVMSICVPWARERSTFTWQAEFRVLALTRLLPVTDVARLMGVTDQRLHRMLGQYASAVRTTVTMAGVTRVGVDETASRRGHNYITLFVDLDTHHVLFATPGRDHTTVLAFREEMLRQGGDPDAVVEFSEDMSEAFRKGVAQAFPNAQISYDKFHVIKAMNDALNQVRRDEQYDCEDLKGTRWLWLHNRIMLSAPEREELDGLLHHHLKTGRAYDLRVQLQEMYDLPSIAQEGYLARWFWRATHSRLPPVRKVAWMVKNHWEGVLHGANTGITNAILEGLNSLLQRARSRARGYSNVQNLINMLYFLAYPVDRRISSAMT